jgi:glycosyltransferase involved in cell wall biosynthesis
MIYLKAIRKVQGIKASAIPLYLPPDVNTENPGLDDNVFFGAISLYLREKVTILKNMPQFIGRILDSKPLLKMAAKRAGTTRTEGMEDMTLDMITGEKAFPEKELTRLVEYLEKDGKPDIIHLSNALIIGLARQLKSRMRVKIVCSLLNEDDWIDEMAEPWQSQAWKLIAREAEYIDAFVTPSNYYRDLFRARTGIINNHFHVVPLGFEATNLMDIQKKNNWPSLGYFCRISEQNGFDKLVDAFIRLRKEERIPGLTLHVSGGYTGDDKDFISIQVKKIRKSELQDSVKFYDDFTGEGKREFFENIDVMCVPVRKHDGYGLYLLEANAAGIPVIQPSTGAFPEIIEKTSGGITYLPDDIEGLASALEKFMNDKELVRKCAVQGRENVLKELSIEKMSSELSLVYNTIV